MFHVGSMKWADGQSAYLILSNGLLILVAVAGSFSWMKKLWGRYLTPPDTRRRDWGQILFVTGVLIGCVAMLVNSSYNPFLYFRF